MADKPESHRSLTEVQGVLLIWLRQVPPTSWPVLTPTDSLCLENVCSKMICEIPLQFDMCCVLNVFLIMDSPTIGFLAIRTGVVRLIKWDFTLMVALPIVTLAFFANVAYKDRRNTWEKVDS